jgi:hypothetical protein
LPPVRLRERLARAAWEARYTDGEFDYAKFLATETEDGGNGRYIVIMAQVDAILAELERPTEAMIEAAWPMVTCDLIDGRHDAMVALIEAVMRAARVGK